MRLEHLLMKHFPLSRKQMKKAIKSGLVLIDGIPATHVSNNVDASLQIITYDGQRIQDTSQVYYLMNKPAGVITATTDATHQTVLDLVAPEDRYEGLYPIGRLDGDTKGLLLLTNNGPLGFRMLHPQYHLDKQYAVTVNGWLGPESVQAFANGIEFIGGEQCKPAKLIIHSASPTESTATVTISEGKFHQVKKMFLCVGVKVTSLTRIGFGPFTLDDYLEPGAYRPLTTEELDWLKLYFDKPSSTQE